MASFVLKNAWIWVNSTDLSASSTSLKINVSCDIKEDTVFGATAKTRVGGLKSWDATLDYIEDTSASPLRMLFNSKMSGTAVTFKAKNDSAATSGTNPCYQGSVLITSLPPIDGAVGDLKKGTVQFKGVGELVRSEV